MVSEKGQTLDIVFRGDIVLGHSLPEVKQRLQQLFKADASKIDALFVGRPVPLKRNLDEATARKYQAVLQKAGADVSLVPSGSSQTNTPKPAPMRRGLSLAPVGVDLLKAAERTRAEPVEVDVSSLSLKPVGTLLDKSEQPTAPLMAVSVPEYDLAAVGEDLVREDERQDLPLPEISVDDWGIAEAGSDLVRPDERQQQAPVAVADLQVDLAPVGSDMGQQKDEKPPVSVDISGLKLEE